MSDRQPQPDIESQKLYEEFLMSGTVANSVSQYVINLKRAARLLNRKISPALFRGGKTPKGIISGLLPERTKPQMQTALERYFEMVNQNFRGAFPRKTARTPIAHRPLPSREKVAALTSNGRRLLEAIVNYCQFHVVDSERAATYPTYGELYRVIVPNSPAVVLHVGRHLRRHGLDDLNKWTQGNPTRPKVTGIIVNKATRRPDNNFFLSHNKVPIRDDHWWRDEVRKGLAFDWSPYLSDSRFTFEDVSEGYECLRGRENSEDDYYQTKISKAKSRRNRLLQAPKRRKAPLLRHQLVGSEHSFKGRNHRASSSESSCRASSERHNDVNERGD